MLVAGDVLTAYASGGGSPQNRFKHFDSDANFIEDIFIPHSSIGAGDDLYIREIRQYDQYIYLAVTDFLDNFDGVIELDRSFNYIRTAVSMNRGDTSQNLGAGDYIGEFDIRQRDGQFFIVSDDEDYGSFVWEYDHNGLFVQRHNVTAPSGYDAQQNGILVNPNNDCEVVRLAYDFVGQRRGAITTYDLCTGATDIPIEIIGGLTGSIGFQPGGYVGNSLYIPFTDTVPNPDVTTLYIYDSSWTLIDAAVELFSPPGYTVTSKEIRLCSTSYLWTYADTIVGREWAIWKVDIATGSIVAGPSAFTPIGVNAADVEIFVTCPFAEIGFFFPIVTLIGAT